jgi:hypothetical protein
MILFDAKLVTRKERHVVASTSTIKCIETAIQQNWC